MPRPYRASADLTAAGTNRQCLPEIATAPLGPRNDTSGECRGAPAPSSGLIPLCKALNERRYRRNRSVRFYRHLVRTGSAFPRLPRAQSALAMTNRGPLSFYRYPIRIGGAAPGAACRSPTAHGRRSVYFSFFIFQSSGFISMRPSPATHERKLSTFHFQFSTSIPLFLYT